MDTMKRNIIAENVKKITDSLKSLVWYEVVMCAVMIVISIYYAIKPQEGCPQWLAIINMISGMCGVVCVFLTAKVNRMNFPFAFVNTVVFMIYLFYFGIWATFWLEALVYFPMNIISWAKWYQHKDEDNQLLAKSKRLTPVQNVIVTGVIIGLTVVVHTALQFLAGDTWMRFAQNFGWNVNAMKWLDSGIFAIGVVAIVLEMLRYTEQYVWWLITDVVAVTQYVLKGDPVYTTKKAIYLIEAFIGLDNWNKLSKKNKTNE